MDFYDKVMTHNNFTVDLVCCKLDRTPIPVSCGQGLSCAAACYVEQAVLCPSQDCEDCENVDEEEDAEESFVTRINAEAESLSKKHEKYHSAKVSIHIR